MGGQFAARDVAECWQIAFDEAEAKQREMAEALNRQDSTGYIILQAQRDAASEIAWRIKHGERKAR